MDRTLPHNLEAEKCVLGAILINNQAFNQAAEVIDAEDFFRDAHRRIFEKMVGLTDRNEPVDLVTLKDELARAGDLEEVGGPAYISALTDGVRDATDSTGRQIYFLRRIPRDPFCDCPSRSNEQTWGLRSYASPPDSPQEGRDVFDVYSMSKGVAVDGTSYADW